MLFFLLLSGLKRTEGDGAEEEVWRRENGGLAFLLHISIQGVGWWLLHCQVVEVMAFDILPQVPGGLGTAQSVPLLSCGTPPSPLVRVGMGNQTRAVHG